MGDEGLGRILMRLGIAVVVAGIGFAIFTALRRPSPESVPTSLVPEWKELSTIVAGRTLPDGRGLTQQQLDQMLYSSAGHGSAGMVAWLLQQGANPRANQKDRGPTYMDHSVLRDAARNRRCESEALLIKKIGDVARASASGTPEQKAASVAEQVANYVNERDSYGIGALHDAVDGGERECVAALLAAGARVDVRNEDGLTPLALAMQKHYNHLVPMLEAALAKQGNGDSSATTDRGSSASVTGSKIADTRKENSAAAQTATSAGVVAAHPWQTLGQFGGIMRMELDRSGTMPTGQGRARIVAERDGHLAGSGTTFEYDCGTRTLQNLTTGEWVDDRMVNERPWGAQDTKWAPRNDDGSQVILNALCGVTIDTGRALGTVDGWRTLETFADKELQILPATKTVNRAQYRLGASKGGIFSGVGWLFELDCAKFAMRTLREQIWKNDEITRDDVSLANTWNSTQRSELGQAVYAAVCPKQ
jgi:hypothetical protein